MGTKIDFVTKVVDKSTTIFSVFSAKMRGGHLSALKILSAQIFNIKFRVFISNSNLVRQIMP